MKISYLAFFLLIFSSISTCMGQGNACIMRYEDTGEINVPQPPKLGLSCWKIIVPENMYVWINITKFNLTKANCSNVYLKFRDTKKDITYTYCVNDKPQPITALGDVIITLYDMQNDGYSSFSLSYYTGIVQENTCLTTYDETGEISVARPPKIGLTCWKIIVPENMYIRINITKFSLTKANCPNVYLRITDTKENAIHTYCPPQTPQPVTALGDVIVSLYDIYNNGYSSFSLSYYTGMVQENTCLTTYDETGEINAPHPPKIGLACWKIIAPENMSVRINITKFSLTNADCANVYLKITDTKKEETHTYCLNDKPQPISALGDAIITWFDMHNGGYSSFSLIYNTEDLICAQEHHFRCSGRSCIHDSKVCDGVEDCDDGSDEIGCEEGDLTMKELNASRDNTIAWLLRNEQSVGWGRNTHRAVTALYLTGNASFHGQNLEEELMASKLELEILEALLRNSTDPLSVSELSMFVNALSVTCHNPRRIYGYDLVNVLGERVSVATYPSPGAYLTLCNSNWTLSQSDIRRLMQPLRKPSKYPFVSDVQAVTVMALTCVKNLQGKEFTRIYNASNIYHATVKNLISGQLSDGSFGNVYTTALVTQALIASGQENNPEWNVKSTIQYLMEELNSSSIDFLSASLALPIFSSKSLVDLADIKCTNISNELEEEKEISDMINELGRNIRVQYSLHVGDEKDVIHTISLRLPEQSSAFDVMSVAQVASPIFKFRHRDVSGHMYVYEIAGIINDPEAGTFWLMYSHKNRTFEHYTESPDKFMVHDGEHLIMWYKRAYM